MNMGYVGKFKLLSVVLGLALAAPLAFASGGGEKFLEGVNYLPIKPPLVVNYGGGTGKVKYIKAEISLRVEDAHAASEVSHHMPLIRDTLIMLLSSLTDEQMSNGEGKELMRQEALTRVNTAIHAQLGGGHGGDDDKKSKHDKNSKAKDDHGKDDHDKDGHDKKDEHAKDDHGKKDAHAKKDDHSKKEERPKKSRASSKPAIPSPVSDLLFDNLVVQK